ncbi:MAG: AlwI family type II restriction endonuclease [Muribaculaceae bacterium]|nr:AlwI family type II restriction endonuclease [Muribaculaceae bacterium]
MATFRSKAINSKTLFFTTSPRTPLKVLPEIQLLVDNLGGEKWTPEAQARFYRLLGENDFFEGAESKTPDLSARDRINRIPKALGLITLPVVGLSEAGKELLESENNKEEILLRQLLKFQLPSPYHPVGKSAADYNVKPYLELLRLVYDMDGLEFDELHLFGMQLVNFERYDEIVEKIKKFRTLKDQNKGRYKEFKQQIFYDEYRAVFADEIAKGKLKTRESKTPTVEAFLDKKIRNLRDYSDAVVRHLRTTGIVNATAIGKILTIAPERKKDVEYILATVDRNPVYIKDLAAYQDYLFNPALPRLLTDDMDEVIGKLRAEFDFVPPEGLSINRLKDLLKSKIDERKEKRIASKVKELKSYKLYAEIEETFDTLNRSYEPSLFFEWNTWRAMTMLNGGRIKANLKFDDEGQPMSTALGNMADIVCDYGDFDVTVEVTMARGQLQFKMEGEPVPRHIGKHKEETKKPTYCFFIAPTINPATIAHFFTLYVTNVAMYGGKCRIIPLTLDTFRRMLRRAVDAPEKPTPDDIRRLFDASAKYARECVLNDGTETDWYGRITERAENWLVEP